MKKSIIIILLIIVTSCNSKLYTASSNYELFDTINLAMRDDISLTTSIYFPKIDQSKRSTVLMQTPYDIDRWFALRGLSGRQTSNPWPEYFFEQDFNVVMQSMRGTGDSEGEFMIFMNSSTDGKDTIEWIKSQEWSNGKVVTFGGSATGIGQYLLAGENPEGLVGQIIQVATPDLYKDVAYYGGALRSELVEGWLIGKDLEEWIQIVKENEKYSSFWYPLNLTREIKNVNIPAIHVGGWYDLYTQGIIDGFNLYQNKGGDGARNNSKLIIGPWSHHSMFWHTVGELTFPRSDYFNEFIKLLKASIRGWQKGELSEYNKFPVVSFYIMGAVDEKGAPGNEWCHTDSWPIPSNLTKFYLTDAGGFSTQIPQQNALSFVFDPRDPVETIGGNNLFLAEGPMDQSSLESRNDVLIFQSDLLDNPVGIAGRIKARIYISSNCTDTDFTVKITDVYPDGRSILIRDGIQRARFREGNDHFSYLTPGNITEISVDLHSSAYIFNKGHRIRIAISSSNYPRFDINPNTGEALANQESNPLIANNTIHFGLDTPSQVILPIININSLLNDSNEFSDFLLVAIIGILPIGLIPMILILRNRKKKQILDE